MRATRAKDLCTKVARLFRSAFRTTKHTVCRRPARRKKRESNSALKTLQASAALRTYNGNWRHECPLLWGSCRSPVFTDVQGQFGYLRRAYDKPARTGLNRVGNGYLNLQRLAEILYSISPEPDAQRSVPQTISYSSPLRLACNTPPQAASQY